MFADWHPGLFVDFERSDDALEIIRHYPGRCFGVDFAQACEQVANSVPACKTGQAGADLG